METEIKLSLPPASRVLVEAHPLFAAAAVHRVHNVSTYHDTPDFALRARGLTLRVRRTGDGFVQTVKSLGGGDGFASRGEWEWTVGSEAVDAAVVARDPDVLALLGHDLGRLAPIFTTDVVRDLRTLKLDGGTVVESAVDTGEVRAGEGRHSLNELELELKVGPVRPMLQLAEDLARVASLRFGPDSKSERGYALLTGHLPPLRGAGELSLPDDVTLGEAFPRIVAAAATEFAAGLSPAARGDVEGIHRLRAAIRKLRTLFALFAPHIEPAAAATFDGKLRAFGRVLGGGRDWDVFVTETLVDAAEDLGEADLAWLRSAAADRRRAAHAAVTVAVEGPQPTEMLLGLAVWTADRGWLKRGRNGDELFRDLLPDLLDRLEHKVLKRGRHLKSLGTEDLHRVRKSLKKLRYASEDVASLFRPGPVARYVGAVKGVLKDLGHINDVAVAVERLDELRGGEGGVAAPAASLLAWTGRRHASRGRDLRRSWRKFRRADAFWP